VLLEVRADNPRAQQLYRRFGFEQIHVRRKYYRDGVDALIMRLELADVFGVHQDIVQEDAGQPGAGQHGQTTPTEEDQQ
jgi:ribosomal-protein-alanine N-acetyltransferase